MKENKCRVCGCTDSHACQPNICWWHDMDQTVCSNCVNDIEDEQTETLRFRRFLVETDRYTTTEVYSLVEDSEANTMVYIGKISYSKLFRSFTFKPSIYLGDREVIEQEFSEIHQFISDLNSLCGKDVERNDLVEGIGYRGRCIMP